MLDKIAGDNLVSSAKGKRIGTMKDFAALRVKLPSLTKSFATKLGVLILLMISLITGSSLIYYYNFTHEVVKQQLQGRLLDLARTGAYVFKPDDRDIIKQLHTRLTSYIPSDYRNQLSKIEKDGIGSVISSENANEIHKSLEYQYIVQLLRQIQDGTRDKVRAIDILAQSNDSDFGDPKIISAYLMGRIPDVKPSDGVMFIADSDWEDIDKDQNGKIVEDEQGNASGNFYRGEAAVFGQPYKDKLAAVSPDWYEDVWGTTMSAVVPLIDEDGSVIATLGIDYDVTIHQVKMKRIFSISITIFVVTIFGGILFTLGLGYLVDKPLSQLSSAAEKLSKQEFNYQVRIMGDDEFALLARTFNQVGRDLEAFTQDLESKVAERTLDLQAATDQITALNDRLSQENAFLGSEVENVLALRRAALPNTMTKLNPGHIEYQYLPSQSVAGDFLDVLTDKRLCIAGTVSGNGLETAVLTLLIRQVCRQYMQRNDAEIVNLFKVINTQIHEFIEKLQLSCTAYLICAEIKSDTVILTGQWHETVVVNQYKWESIYDINAAAPLGIAPEYEHDIKSTSISLYGSDVYLLSPGMASALAVLEPGVKPHVVLKNMLGERGSLEQVIAFIQETVSDESRIEDITAVKISL